MDTTSLSPANRAKAYSSKGTALTGSKEASHTANGWGLNRWGLVGWQFLLEKVMLSNERRLMAGSSSCCWKHKVKLILVFYFFPKLLLLEECEDKRHFVRSIMARLMSS